MDKIPITNDGYETLKNELDNLKGSERKKTIKAIAEAREHGDLKENAEYHAAREKQSFIEGRILELEAILSRADIINVKEQNGKNIMFGATVKIVDEDENKKKFQIVGEHEGDINKNKISISSPLASSLIGKTVGDFTEVKTPSGLIEYEILTVTYK